MTAPSTSDSVKASAAPGALFEVDSVTAPAAGPELSAGGRRTHRQLALLRAGRHPLVAALRSCLRLHAEAAPLDDLTAAGRRCGNCWYRRPALGNSKWYPKCHFAHPDRITHGTGTDVRAWWPACVDHVWRDAKPGEDIARCSGSAP